MPLVSAHGSKTDVICFFLAISFRRLGWPPAMTFPRFQYNCCIFTYPTKTYYPATPYCSYYILLCTVIVSCRQVIGWLLRGNTVSFDVIKLGETRGAEHADCICVRIQVGKLAITIT